MFGSVFKWYGIFWDFIIDKSILYLKYMYNYCFKILKLYVNKYVKVLGGFEFMILVKIISLILYLLKVIYF